ncbi:Fe-S cluster biogenesis protein NfuA, 4Fe-4S-binding domain [Raineyella antarctica]|uniref:Fe-S cluster biogenesis protein NfuA, 4Fe-4S-binding domain n=1 Tax=Raineyella antarctica TaxID=1577474 RepID=A0A1G6GF40_9ACTN|nr:NifU family protein [Raineyella antarctica]SDB80365.1 Fe-S cluster biogenesis protein NfuA, 4Fe-4S-binding domain [Raineyella antarctica]
MIALHPEATEDPRTLRWVVPAGTLDFVGVPAAVPSPLAGLLADGTLTGLVVEPAAVLTTGSGDWRTVGATVRTALVAALDEPEAWRAPADTPRTVLAAAVEQVIAGEVGDYVRSHGGSARLVETEGSLATIALEGACSACPARGLTLDRRFSEAVAALCPGAEVRLEENGQPIWAWLRR